MASLQTRILRVPLATLIGSTLCTAALLAQTAQTPTFPNAPQGFDVPRQGIATGRVERVEYTSSVTGGKKPAMVYTPAGYSSSQKYPVLYLLHGIGGNESALAGTGGGRRHPRQPDRRQEGGADDRRDAARPFLERAGDITLWRTRWTGRARCGSRGGRGRRRSGPPGRAARGRRRPPPEAGPAARPRVAAAARGWRSSSRRTRRSSASC